MLKIETIAIKDLREHPANRKRFDAARLEELTASVKDKGILNPLLVWRNGKGCIVLAGARRMRAALGAGLAEVPCIVREDLDEKAAIELLVIDNLQREDVHALEEAEGYKLLHGKHKYTVEQLAAKVGKSVAYVYARLKLCELTKEAKKAFFEDRITAGHAILLARLKPEDQARALDLETEAVFRFENLLFDPEGRPADKWDGVTTCSVRELQHWIDMNVRIEPEGVDQMFFPETAEVLEAAKAEEATVLAITREYMLPPERKGKAKTLTCNAWKRADGKGGSKKCEHARPAIVAIGEGRGEAFDVCTAKEKCKVHWASEMREKAKRAKAVEKGETKASGKRSSWEIEEEKRKRREEREKAELARWEKATPAIASAVAAAVLKAPTKAKGLLAEIVLGEITPDPWDRKRTSSISGLVPLGTTAEDLVRHLAWLVLCREIAVSYLAPQDFPKRAKAFGVDAKKLLDEHAPAPMEEKPAKASKKKSAKRK